MTSLVDTPLLDDSDRRISLIGAENETMESQQAIYDHAVKVLFHHSNMRRSALNVCVHLYLCREQFKASHDTGWQAFCEENFARIGMQATHIRSAIRTGRALAKSLNSERLRDDPRATSTFESMSRFALTAFSESPEEIREELATRLIALSEDKGKPVSSTDVRTEVSALMSQLADKDDLLRRKDEALSQMNSDLQANDARVSELRDTVERLNRRITELSKEQSPVVVETGDPASALALKQQKDLREEIEAARRSLSEANSELVTLRDQRSQLEQEIEGLTDAVDAKKKERSVWDAFSKDLADLKAKWTSSYFTVSGRDLSTATRGKVQEAVGDLRALADHLERVAG